jgi:hypothetical protein
MTRRPLGSDARAKNVFHDGVPLRLERVLTKAGRGPEDGVRFEHFLVRHPIGLP